MSCGRRVWVMMYLILAGGEEQARPAEAVGTDPVSSQSVSLQAMNADLDRIARCRDEFVQRIRERRAKEEAVEPARDFALELRGGVRAPTRDSRFSTPIEERRKAKDVEIVLPRRGGKWLPGRAAVERFGGRRQYVETSQLASDGGRIGGVLRLVLHTEPQWLSGAVPSQPNHPLPEDMRTGWRTEDGMVREAPLPRLTAYRVAIEIKGDQLAGRFEGEDALGRFEGQAIGTVRPAPDEFRDLHDEWTATEKPGAPEQCVACATRLYRQVRALDLMQRYGLPWRDEAMRMVGLPPPQWADQTQPAGAATAAAAMSDAVRRMREWVEAAWAGRDAAAVPSYELSNAEVRLGQAQALGTRADGTFEMPGAAAGAGAWHFVPEWRLAGPFVQDDGWAFHLPLLPEIVPALGAGYAVEMDRLLAHYRPDPGALVRWTPAAWAAGVLRPPLWGDNTGWPQQTAAGLRCARWFAFARVHSAEAQTVTGIFDFDYRGKLFVNGRLVCASDIALDSVARLGEQPPWPAREQDAPAAPAWRRVCRLDLRRGVNELLVSCENVSRDTWFSLFLGSGQALRASREVKVHAGWGSPCADAIRRAAVGRLDVPPLVEIQPGAAAPVEGPTWSVPGTPFPAQWRRLGPLPNRPDKEMDSLRERVLAMHQLPGAELKDGERTAVFEPVERDWFGPNNWVDLGKAHASPSGGVSYWYVAMECRFPQTVRPSVEASSDVQTRLWVSGRLISAKDCLRVRPGFYPLLVELRQAAAPGGAPPWLQQAAGNGAPAQRWLCVSLKPMTDPLEETATHLHRLRNCRLLCEWALNELPGTPEAQKARLMLAAVAPAEQTVAASLAAAQERRPRKPDRLPAFRIEKVTREQGADPEFACHLRVAHASLTEELPLEVRARIPANVPVCRAAVLNMDMGGYGIYWNRAWIEECRRIQCAMIHLAGDFIGRKAMYFAGRDGGPLLTEALRAIAKEAQRPELPNLPWVPWGLSGGGYAADEMRECSPERLLGCIPYHGESGFWAHGPFAEPTDAALAVPMLLFVGGGDMGCGKESMLMRFLKERAHGGLAAHVREPGVGHVANGPVPFQGAWIEALMRLRLPADWDPRAGPPEMRTIAEAHGWLGNLVTCEIAPADEYKGDASRAAWLPDEGVARMWQAVVGGDKGRR